MEFEIPEKLAEGSRGIADQAVYVSDVKAMHICWMFSLRILISGSDQLAAVAFCVFAVVYQPCSTTTMGFITERKKNY